jgi:hypothetical protein
MSPTMAPPKNPALSPEPAGSSGKRKKPTAPDQARPLWTLGLFLMLVGLGTWETGATLHQHFTAPREEDWRALAEKLGVAHKPAEPILFAPAWIDPLGRQYFGHLIPFELNLLSDVDRFSRVWQVSIRDARHPWLVGLSPRQSWTLGGITVSLFEKPAQEVLFDFTRQVQRAQVDRVGDALLHCPWQEKRFACDRQRGWNWVGPYLAEVNHHPYRCIYAHPVDGNLMRLTFTAVPLGQTLVGYTGIDNFENRKLAKKPVRLKVFVGDRLTTEIVHQNNWPWHRFAMDTHALAGQRATVRFEISAESAYGRPFCFAAETRR